MVNRQRFNGLVRILNDRNLDAAFLAPSSDLKYVTGLDLKSDSRLKGAVITREGNSFFLCPSLYMENIRTIEGAIRIVEWTDEEGFKGAFRRGLDQAGLCGPMTMAFTRGIEAGDMIDAVDGLDVEGVNGFFLLSPMRSVKSADELAKMRHASHMNDKMMEALVGYLRPGLRERDIRRFVMDFHESQGGRPRVPGVSTGVNSASPHYGGDNDRVVSDRDIVMVDCGGWYDGYSHDMTRTFFVGEPTEEQRRVYGIVLEAQLAAEEQVTPGAIPAEIDETARAVIRSEGYGDYFPHRLGHWIGLDGQEGPCVGEENREPLVAGNCLTIEPGIYMQGHFGVRIEDVVMVTEDGREVVNRFSKELMIL